MAQGGIVICRVVLENEAAADALGEAAELIREAYEDTPWKDELGEALERLEYAVTHLAILEVGD